jgi:hypothetical protein
MEGAAAEVIRNIIQARLPPTPQRDNHIVLVFHLVSQHARTTYAADEQSDFSDKFAKQLLRPTLPRDGITPDDLERVKVVPTNPVGQALRHILPAYPLLLDLRCVVLANTTPHGLITSDNPVVLYNQLLEERTYASNTGLQSVGLQIYLPLSPKVAVFLYDPDVYGVGSRSPTRICLENPNDIEQLNALQLLSAVENVYFHPKETLAHSIPILYGKVRHRRRKRMTNLFTQREKPRKPNETRELVGFYREDIRCNFRPSFLKTLKRAKRAKPELMRRIAVRSPWLCDKYDRFREQVKQGKYTEGDFARYLYEES